MSLSRRQFVTDTGLALAASAIAASQSALAAKAKTTTYKHDDWSSVREQGCSMLKN